MIWRINISCLKKYSFCMHSIFNLREFYLLLISFKRENNFTLKFDIICLLKWTKRISRNPVVLYFTYYHILNSQNYDYYTLCIVKYKGSVFKNLPWIEITIFKQVRWISMKNDVRRSILTKFNAVIPMIFFFMRIFYEKSIKFLKVHPRELVRFLERWEIIN